LVQNGLLDQVQQEWKCGQVEGQISG